MSTTRGYEVMSVNHHGRSNLRTTLLSALNYFVSQGATLVLWLRTTSHDIVYQAKLMDDSS